MFESKQALSEPEQLSEGPPASFSIYTYIHIHIHIYTYVSKQFLNYPTFKLTLEMTKDHDSLRNTLKACFAA